MFSVLKRKLPFVVVTLEGVCFCPMRITKFSLGELLGNLTCMGMLIF